MLFDYWRSYFLNNNYFDESIKGNALEWASLKDRD